MQERNPAKLLLDVHEVAELLGIGRSHLYGYIVRGELRSISLGRRRKITRDAISDFLQRQEEQCTRDLSSD